MLAAVTGALVAAGLGHDRQNFTRKADRFIAKRALNGHRNLSNLVLNPNHQHSGAVAEGRDNPARLDTNFLWLGAGERRLSGVVMLMALGILSQYDNPLPNTRTVQKNLSGKNLERSDHDRRRAISPSKGSQQEQGWKRKTAARGRMHEHDEHPISEGGPVAGHR
jgi:hypothetical protein